MKSKTGEENVSNGKDMLNIIKHLESISRKSIKSNSSTSCE